MNQKHIGLLDCNNFFVSCERLFRPDLLKKPVVVLSGNDGCVVARSQEVKDKGIPMGVPYFKIKDIVKKEAIITFSSHFALYRDVSRRVFTTMKDLIGEIEQYSIDEAFFLTHDDPLTVSNRLKREIEKLVGIPISVGIGNTKTQAKYANSCAKKGCGVYVLEEDEWSRMTPDIPLADIWGVGGKMELQYKKRGLSSVADLLAVDTERIRKIFGLPGVRLQEELRGKVAFPVEKRKGHLHSIASSRSFKSDTTDPAVLADAVAYHTRNITAKLRKKGLKANKLSVTMNTSRYGDFVLHGGSLSVLLSAPSNDTFLLLKEAKKLVERLYKPGVPYKKVGLTLSDLQTIDVTQSDLFAENVTAKNTEEIMKILDDLNRKQSREVVLVGTRLKTEKWQSKSSFRSPAYTTKWTGIQTVKAI
ncbi:MAG: Y-family DNA polymerase [Candidatus Nomurabacteria bacterium]|nr:MAG: Y-family DNA polymerase [Candidatus Nomurabacteria bacterium]